MFVAATAEYFKYKLVSSVLILACWDNLASLSLVRDLSYRGVRSTVTCDHNALLKINRLQFQGVVIFADQNNGFLNKLKPKQFGHWYKWLVIGDQVPINFRKDRYDVDVSLLDYNTSMRNGRTQNFPTTLAEYNNPINIYNAYVHPRDGISLHCWATWTRVGGLLVNSKCEVDRIRRRQDLKMYPLNLVAPMALYTPESTNKSFKEYLRDTSAPEVDSAVRVGYAMASLTIELLHATEVLHKCKLWATENHNSSMLKMIRKGDGDISGAILRLLPIRAARTDVVTYLWPFHVGFLYIADRDSSSNMFVEPFSAGVWWCCLGIGMILAISQRMTAQAPVEKEGAFMAVLATWLQQDASAPPEGPSGRWTFVVMSVSSMLVHAYYTSAIVSALMSTGTNGPKNFRELADSRYTLASEPSEWMQNTMFEVNSGSDDLEYLKKKKKTSKFYQNIKTGIEMIRQGGTAYHCEYNHVYPHLSTFRDDQICKLDKVDTVPETLTWLLTTRQGQWTEILRIASAWLHESGLTDRLVSIYRIKPPQCRDALLAERVKIGDVLPLIALTLFGVVLSVLLLGMEILFSKWKNSSRAERGNVSESFASSFVE